MKRFLCLIGLVLVAFSAGAQYRPSSYSSVSSRPDWVDGDTFKDGRNSYVEVISGTGYDESEARQDALEMIALRRGFATGTRVKVGASGSISFAGGNELTVKARVLDEYAEHLGPGRWRVTLLVQTAKNPEYPFERVEVTDKYPVSARILIPGMAQLHKGSTVKGVSFMVGEVALVGGIVLSEAMRASNVNLMQTTHDTNALKTYLSRSQTWSTARNVCIAGAAALYVWNLVDGVAARGKSRLVVGEYASLDFNPYADTRSAGVALALNF